MSCVAIPDELIPVVKRRAWPVIADAGNQAWVVVWNGAKRPELGERFRFRGRSWRIERLPRCGRGHVARPVDD